MYGNFIEEVQELRAENARLQGLACLICGRDKPCELDTNKGNDPNWPGSPCTFDPSPIDAARRFMRERDGYKVLAKRFAKDLHYKDVHELTFKDCSYRICQEARVAIEEVREQDD